MHRFLIASLASILLCPGADLDRDGLDDGLEQELLLKFAPVLQISNGECDEAPAAFRPGRPDPEVIRRNGTVYGQVFPVGEFLEIHYYHLWQQDCGRVGHALDVERVSVLLSKTGERWRSLYWYAAAHETTTCDRATAASAVDLGSQDAGVRIWVSRGKHASYLDPASCSGGCGGDVCTLPVRVVKPAEVVNIGEFGAVMNGAEWIHSARWKFADKMTSDFSEDLLDTLRAKRSSVIVVVNPGLRRKQAVVRAGNTTVSDTSNALATANRETNGAVSKSSDATIRSLSTAKRSVVKFLKRMGGS